MSRDLWYPARSGPCPLCSTRAPELTLLEAIRYSDRFVPALQYQRVTMPTPAFQIGMRYSVTAPPEFQHLDVLTVLDETRGHMGDRGNVVPFKHAMEPHWEHYVVLSAVPLTYGPGCPSRPCPLPECPLACQSAPVAAYVPDALIYDHAAALPGASPVQGPGREQVYADGVLVHKGYRAARAAHLQALESERALVGALLSPDGTSPESLPDIGDIMRETQGGAAYNVSFAPVVLQAYALGLLPDGEVGAFFDRQVALLDRMVDAAVERRNRSERETTEIFRGLSRFYGDLRDAAREAEAAASEG